MYAVIDIETTGLNPRRDRIIEIAIVIFDGEKIVDQFTTLINPERKITSNITRLTGITNEMVENAPFFWEVAKDIVLLTEDRTFVAHNVNFDYSFIQNEFSSLGYQFKRKKTCTVQLSRRYLPGKKSYSLGKLCAEMAIVIEGRHRAAGDALATTELLNILLKRKDEEKLPVNNAKLFESLLEDIPEETGVYYLINDDQDVIYIGKSTNIRNRILSHINNKSRRSQKMIDETKSISFDLTGSELIALLKESDEIKDMKPRYNRAQRRKMYRYGLFSFENYSGYLEMKIEKLNGQEQPHITFSSAKEARERLFSICENYELCQKLCALYESAGACFYYELEQCKGACIGKEAVEKYNERVRKAIHSLHFKWENFIVVDKGRDLNERSVVLLENGIYRGYGYVDIENEALTIDNVKDRINVMSDNRDVRQIIKTYLNQKKFEKIIPF